MKEIERIQRVADIVSADVLGDTNSPQVNAADMFVRGAKWYAQHIWHSPSERPTHYFRHNKVTLVMLRSTEEEATIETFSKEDLRRMFFFDRFRKYDRSVIAWAYLAEINPHTNIYYYGDK